MDSKGPHHEHAGDNTAPKNIHNLSDAHMRFIAEGQETAGRAILEPELTQAGIVALDGISRAPRVSSAPSARTGVVANATGLRGDRESHRTEFCSIPARPGLA